MSLTPSFNLCYLSNLSLYVAAVAPHIPEPRRQMWILSTMNSAIMSVLGIYETWRWWGTGDLTTTPLSNNVLEFMKAYLLVDLTYNAIYHRQRMHLLECWIHHIAYIFVFDQIVKQGFAGMITVFYILELPSFIRAIGSLYPNLRADMTFGILFGLLRVVYPFYLAFYLTLPKWAWCVLTGAQGLHIYWFSQWMKKYGHRVENVHIE